MTATMAPPALALGEDVCRRARLSYRRFDIMVGNRILRSAPRRLARQGVARRFTDQDIAVAAICARLGELGMNQASQRVVAGIIYDSCAWPLEPGMLMVAHTFDWFHYYPFADIPRGVLRVAEAGWVIELPPHLAP